MFMRSATCLILVLLCTAPFAQESPNLGVPASDEQIAGWDISIPPSGEGLPAGFGTAEQGANIFEVKCAACHGKAGIGRTNDRLAGGHGTLKSSNPVRTVGSYWPYATTLFDYIRRAMPYYQPSSLSNEDVYALTAYLLAINGIIGTDDVMNASSLPNVEMPNKDGFIRDWGGE